MDARAGHVVSTDSGDRLIARLLSLTLERLRERTVALGASDEEIDEPRRVLEDPANKITSQTTCVAQARRATYS